MDNIQVAIRVRPLIAKETTLGQNKVWNVKENTLEPLDQNGKPGIPYTFDRIFDEHMTTYDLFQEIAKPIIDAAVQGFHGTIFAYGQSSSGKTFTMTGSAMHPGIIKLAVNEIFSRIDKIPDREYLVRCCYMEIYNEKVSDLLSSEDKLIKIQEDTERNVNVIGVEERYVMNENDLNAVLKEGEARRHMAETKQNDRSSRSHCILRVIIESRQVDDESAVMVAHLNFVDLAGSEKAGENTGDRFREGCSINKSLFTLARIIAKLSEGVSNQHIGYRDSKLTRILQNALGGNSKTAVIATITPASMEESHSTLKFASRAKTISNKPKVNEVLSDAAQLKRSRMEIQKLQEKINAMENIDVCELKGEKEDLEKKLKEKEEMEQKYHDLLSSLKYVIQSGATQQKEAIPQSKRRKTWCPGKGASLSSPRRFSFINRMSFFNEAEEVGIEDISPPHIRKRNSEGKYKDSVEKKHVSFPADPVREEEEEEDEAFLVDPLAKELLDLQDKYEELLQDYENLRKEKAEMDEYHFLELETNKEGMERVGQLEETEKKNVEELEKLRKQLADLEEKCLEKSETMKSMEEKMNTLSDENFHLEHRLQIQNKKVTEYQAELNGVWKKEEGEEQGSSEVKDLKSANEQLSQELEKCQSSFEDMKSEVERLKAVNNEQTEEMEKLKSSSDELKKHQTAVETLNNKVHDMEMTIKMFQETVEEFQVENKQLQSAVEEKTHELEELKARAESNEDTSDAVQELQKKVETLEEEIQEHLQERGKLQTTSTELENKLEEMMGKLEGTKDAETTETENIKALYDEAIRKIEELEWNLEEQCNEVRKLSEVAEENQDIENQLSDRDSDVMRLRESLQSSERSHLERIEELEKELQKATQSHTEEVDTLRKDMAEYVESGKTMERVECVQCAGRKEDVCEEVQDHQLQTDEVEKLDKSMNVSLEVSEEKETDKNEDRGNDDLEGMKTNEVMKLEEIIEELKDKIEMLEQEKESLKDPTELMEQFQNIVEVMKKEHAKEIQKMQEDLESRPAKGVEEELEEIQKDLDSHPATVLQEQLEELQGRYKELSEIVEEKEALCQELKKAVTDKDALCVELHERIMQNENFLGSEEAGACVTCQKNAEEEKELEKRLTQEIVQLEEHVCKLKEENENLLNQKSEVHFSNLQDEVNSLQAQLSENERKITSLEEENEKLLDSVKQNDSMRSRSESLDYTEMCERLSMENMSLQERVEDLQEEINSLQDQMKHYQQEVECLEDNLKETQEENQVSRNKVWELEEKLISHTVDSGEPRECQATQTEEVTPQSEEQASQTEDPVEDSPICEEQALKIEDGLQCEEHVSQTEDFVEVRPQCEEQGSQTDECMEASPQCEEQASQTEEFVEARPQCEEQASQTEEWEESEQKMDEGDINSTKEQLQLLIEENFNLKERLSTVEEEAKQLEEQSQGWQQREEALMREITSLQGWQEELDERFQDVTKNWEDAEEKVLELTHCLEVAKEETENLTQRHQESEAEIRGYQRQVEDLQQSMAALTAQKEQSELQGAAQCQELETRIQTLKEEHESLQSTLEEREKDIGNLKQQISLLEETQREFQTELQKLEGEKKLLENTILNQSKSNSSDNETEKISLEEKEEIEKIKKENETMKKEREQFQLEEKMKRSKLVSEFNSQRVTIKKQQKTIQDLLKELDEVDTKAVEKEVLDKLEKENKENDRLWAEIGVKDREIKRLQGYQSQCLDLANQVSELERSKLELEKKLKEARKTTEFVETGEGEMFTPHAREIADKKRENFALRMELEKVKDSVKDREQAYNDTVDRYEKRISSLKNEIRRLQQDNETSVLVPCPMKKTLFHEPAEKPCDSSSQSNVSCNDSGVSYKADSGVSYKASCSGLVDQYSNILLKKDNKQLEKENKKLTTRLTQLEMELRRYKENPKKSEEREKVVQVHAVKKEPLEDSKVTQLDFSIPKVPPSIQVQSAFRMPEASSKKKDLPTDDINSQDQCATQ
ncbi:uncharacterized protein LOC111118975 isoform X1 [Crassostrea virginica]